MEIGAGPRDCSGAGPLVWRAEGRGRRGVEREGFAHKDDSSKWFEERG